MPVKKDRSDEPLGDNPLAVWLRQQEHPTEGPPPGSWADARTPPGTDATQPLGGLGAEDEAVAANGWNLGPEEDVGPRRARPRLLMLAVIPWVLAVFLAVGFFSGSDEQRATPPAPALSAPTSPPPAPTPPAVVDQPPPPTDAGLREVAALTVRSALSGPVAATQRAAFVEDAVATGVEAVGDGAVVTVSALILEGGPDGWDAARVRRYAVPVRIGAGGPEAAGAPWPVADPPPRPGTAPTPETDPAVVEAVSAGLTRAGYRDLRGVAVTRDPALAGVLLAHVEGTGPGAAGAGVWDVWLRDGPRPDVFGDTAANEPAGQVPTMPLEGEDPR